MMKSQKIKVAILGPFPPAIGGIATNIQNLLRSPLNKEFTIVKFRTTSRKHGTVEYSQEKILKKIVRVFFDLLFYLYFLQKESPQIVHINTSFGVWAFWRDSMYLVISKIFKKKVLFQIHGGNLNEFWERNFYGTKAIIKQILKIPELIAVLSSVQRRPFEKNGFVAKVKVIPNMIESNKYKKGNNYRARFGISGSKIVVLFIASLFNKEKGIMELLKSIPPIIKEHNDILFIFVGGGKEKGAMMEFCRKETLEKYIKFTGYLEQEDIIKILNSSDIFVLPSYGEGFPLVILEAMAAGLPIISTPVGAIPEVINDGENGFFVKPMDHIALAEKIILLIKNEYLRNELGNNNIKKIKGKYDLNTVANIFKDNYRETFNSN